MTDNEIIKALECMASVNENGLCYAEQENIKRMKEGKPYIVCSNIKDEKFECCPHYQEPFDTCMDDGSHQKALQSALDIITRQKAEIERLKEHLKEVCSCYHRMESLYNLKCKELDISDRLLERNKSEAIKEFAERLKEKSFYCARTDGKDNFMVLEMDIDNIVKEMVGERE